MKQFDASKAKVGDKIVTRNGYQGRVICLDRKSANHSEVVVLLDKGEFEDTMLTGKDGKFHPGSDHNLDIFFAPVKRKGWVNLYSPYASKEDAVANATYDVVATIEVEWEE